MHKSNKHIMHNEIDHDGTILFRVMDLPRNDTFLMDEVTLSESCRVFFHSQISLKCEILHLIKTKRTYCTK